jgi:peptide/nickel transport system permease protein
LHKLILPLEINHMAELSITQTETAEKGIQPSPTMLRIARFVLIRSLTLLATVAVGVYVTIWVANMGGFVDTIHRGQIGQTLMGMEMGGTWDHIDNQEEKHRQIEETRAAMEEARGLNDPYLVRTFRYLWNSMTLGLGEGLPIRIGGHGYGSGFSTSFLAVQSVILERLPFTLLLFVSANLLTFVAGLFMALILSRRSGGIVDRIVIILSAVSSAPTWVYGTILIIVLAAWLRWLPFPGEIDLKMSDSPGWFLTQVLPQLALPVFAIFVSVFFQTIYTWRTYFLIYANEDYVEMAKAKGLPGRVIERKYILRPSLPYVMTSFTLMVMGLWQGSMALELLFNWPGVGLLFLTAVRTQQIALIVGVAVIFAYLLAGTILILDIAYVLVDPRATISGNKSENGLGRSARLGRLSLRDLFRRDRSTPPARAKDPWREAGGSQTRLRWADLLTSLQTSWQRLKPNLVELWRYPSAIFGAAIILGLVTLAVTTMINVPYQQAIVAWRGHESDWYRNPRYAKPAWINYFRSEKLPVSVFLDSRESDIKRTVTMVDADMREIAFSFPIHFNYSVLPQEFFINSHIRYSQKHPLISLAWVRPDGVEIDLGSFSPRISGMHYPLADERVQRRLRGQTVLEGMFGGEQPLAGDYELKAYAYVFEEEADVDLEVILQGYVHGLAGTDQNRRDLMFAIRWGAVVALAFGLFGAVATNLISMILAAAGVWLSGWVDGLIQRVTEVMMILPVLPMVMMVYILYSKSIWMILSIVVLLTIFSTTLRNYRSAFLQIKNAPYIESAQAYGTGSGRIIFKYMVPRIAPLLAPQLVIMVPGYIFYEATLAYLGVSDPYLPTWGKVIYQAITNNALQTHPHWLLIPMAFMILSSLGFALLGLALDKILNPRLRRS